MTDLENQFNDDVSLEQLQKDLADAEGVLNSDDFIRNFSRETLTEINAKLTKGVMAGKRLADSVEKLVSIKEAATAGAFKDLDHGRFVTKNFEDLIGTITIPNLRDKLNVPIIQVDSEKVRTLVNTYKDVSGTLNDILLIYPALDDSGAFTIVFAAGKKGGRYDTDPTDISVIKTVAGKEVLNEMRPCKPCNRNF